ncbi:MAG TPA: exosortase H-associated membrane protein [Cellvibrionaceae bacterium]
MPSPPENFSLSGYFLRVLLWLPVFFALWYFLSGFFNIVPGLASQWLANILYNGLVVQIESAGRHIEYITSLKMQAADGAGVGNVVVTLNPLIYSWNIPVLLALCFAVHDSLFSNARVVLAIAALFPLHAWGLTAELFATVLFRQGTAVAEQVDYSGWQLEAVAMAYQFGYLMLPVIGAVSIWFLANRQLVEQLMANKGR